MRMGFIHELIGQMESLKGIKVLQLRNDCILYYCRYHDVNKIIYGCITYLYEEFTLDKEIDTIDITPIGNNFYIINLKGIAYDKLIYSIGANIEGFLCDNKEYLNI